MSYQHSIGYPGDSFTGRSKDPTNNIKVPKEKRYKKTKDNPEKQTTQNTAKQN